MSFFKFANNNFRNKNFSKSIELYSICINEENFYAYYENRAYAYLKLNRFDYALQDFTEAYKRNINSKISYNFIKKSYNTQKHDNNHPLLSIIIPVYNTEKYLSACIQSVVNQTLDEIEIIIVNDGSNDNSLNIINVFMMKYNNIILINNVNPSGNPGSPRNQGIDIAKGKYLAFVDSDDWIDKDYLKTLVDCAVEHDSDIVFSGGFINHEGSVEKKIVYPPRNFSDSSRFDYKYHESFMIWDKIYNTNMIKRLGIRLGETKAAVDIPYILQSYFYLPRVTFCNKIGYHYRRETEVSVTKTQRRQTDCNFEITAYNNIFNWIEKYAINKNYIRIVQLKMIQSYLYTLKVIDKKYFYSFLDKVRAIFQGIDNNQIKLLAQQVQKYYLLRDVDKIKSLDNISFWKYYRENGKKDTPPHDECSFILHGNKKGILFFPEWTRSNPYQKLLYEAINNTYNVNIRGYKPNFFSKETLEKNKVYCNVLHLHWLHSFMDFSSDSGNKKFISTLNYAKEMGYRIIYTAHNIISHDTIYHNREIEWRKEAMQYVDYILAHGSFARSGLIAQLDVSKEKIYIVPHGLYTNYYKNTLSKTETRERLQIPNDSFVFCFFGNIKPYKGLDELIKIYNTLSIKYNSSILLIAGKCNTNSELTKIKKNIAMNKSIIFKSDFIQDDDIQLYMNSADCIILPYKNILTSGILMLALSFNKPVIAPNTGILPEILTDKQGFLFSSYRELALIMDNCLQEHSSGRWDPTSFDFHLLNSYTWENIVKRKPFDSIFQDNI